MVTYYRIPHRRSHGNVETMTKANTSAASNTLTDQQMEFVRSISQDNVTPTEAARRAGYSQPNTAAWRLMKSPQVAAAVKQAHFLEVDSNLTGVALKTLKAVMEDEKAPASARVAAARAVVDMSGLAGRKLSDEEAGKDTSESMTDFLKGLSDEALNELSSAVRNEKNKLMGQLAQLPTALTSRPAGNGGAFLLSDAM